MRRRYAAAVAATRASAYSRSEPDRNRHCRLTLLRFRIDRAERKIRATARGCIRRAAGGLRCYAAVATPKQCE